MGEAPHRSASPEAPTRRGPTEEEWAEVDDEGLAYRRSCGVGAKRYDGTMPVRELTRGLNTLVFVPWEDCEEHVLNNTTEQMDFFVTG